MQMTRLRDLIDASTPGWSVATVNAINNAGQITGMGYFQGIIRGYDATPVPEPDSYAAMGLGTILVMRFGKRRVGHRGRPGQDQHK